MSKQQTTGDSQPPKKEQTNETIRLDSLSRRTSTSRIMGSTTTNTNTTTTPTAGSAQLSSSTSGPSTKFTPKAVVRRSKQEREAALRATAAAQDKAATSTDRRSSHNGATGGPRRRSRADHISATAAVGPLAAPSTYNPKSSSSRMQASGSAYLTPTSEANSRKQGEAMLAQLGLMKTQKPETDNLNSADIPLRSNSASPSSTHDDNRIDISTFEPIDSEISAQFPVRPAHDDVDEDSKHDHSVQLEPNDTEKEEQQKLLDDYKALAAVLFKKVEPETESEPEPKPVVKVKKEPMPDDAMEIDEKTEPQVEQDQSEAKAKVSANAKSDLIFIQLPLVMPKFESESDAQTPDDDIMIIDNDDSNNNATTNKSTQQLFPQEGRIGTLRRHKSGKITMMLGDMIMNVTQGTSCNYLQDVVVHDQEHKSAYQLGQVQQRIIVTPDLTHVI